MKFFNAWPHIAPSLQAAKLKLQELEEKEAAEDASDPQHEETDKPWRTEIIQDSISEVEQNRYRC